MTQTHLPPTPSAPPPREAVTDADRGHPVRLGILAALIALAGLRGGWPVLVVIFGVVLMIVLHELGHYVAARLGGMKVTEFFVGFGPKIWSTTRGETEYGIKAIPAGAYVKVIGMNNLDEVDPADESRTYRQATFPRRLAVAVAGSTMHFAQALVLLFVLYAFVGIPGGSLTHDREWEVAQVMEGSAASAAGLREGDRVVSLDGASFDTFTSFAEEISTRPGESAELVIDRDGRRSSVTAVIGRSPADPDVGVLGVRRGLVTTTVGPVAAVSASVTDFTEQVGQTVGFLGSFFTPSGITDFAGDVASGSDDSSPAPASGSGSSGAPAEEQDDGRIISILGAVRIGADLAETGLLGFLVFFVGINVTIGVFNLLPVLPLDGGHVVVAVYERIREAIRGGRERYVVDMTKLMPVVYAVFLVLVMLGVTSIYLDLIDPVTL